ncbi:bifunctional adenosylcobinamide kinase/adenosylcobinamide-phosphate guanylyltransferase [Halomonas sp.]|uniref:bifunctional adenosylcobinamide kinase/adenosylcobinamide-phosphate guanylyltransferase n=1 Tax=Halomonas sp. TaxID=1486246 RepID=UPI00261FBEC2|nr:bifunctional adenosylcobinamide kinase/adenosylcobinamide-phosphate guanylyltransferase [Halomonas sp.]
MHSIIGGACSGRRQLAAQRFPCAGWHRLVKGEGAEECLAGHAGREVLVVDGIAAWLSAALAEIPDDDALRETWLRLLDGFVAAPCEAVLIFDEMGRGIVPMDSAARRLRDHNGWLVQAAVERSRVAWYLRHGLCKQLK